MRVYVTAAAKRAVVVQEDLFARADVQANPEKVSKALCTELKAYFVKKCFRMRGISKVSNIVTSRYVHAWKFVKNEKGEMESSIRLRP
eukprot:7432108-Pyramimonas_sp.AAC.1